jgi:DNA-binding transcriptional MerR regulator
MEYRVAELATAAGVAVDTVRFYQARGLLASPRRRGRFAIYESSHLDRIRRIRSLLDAGFSLAQIGSLLEGESEATAPQAIEGAGHRGLLAALAEKSVGVGTVSRSELAEETGVPEALITSAIQAGLIAAIEIKGEERFPRSDLEMVESALEILGMGLPLDRLLELAAFHASNIDQLTEQAIDLFDDYVRKPYTDNSENTGNQPEQGEEAVRRVFERLLPQATRIVALHFQRTVVARALARLRGQGDATALELALEATQSSQREVQWR